MLFRPVLLRLLPRYRRLMRDGARASAVVLAIRPWGPVVGHHRPYQRLSLRVHYDDGTTAEIERVEHITSLIGHNTAGSTLPVRYEPADRSYVEVDCAVLRGRTKRRQEKRDQAAVRAAEKKLRDRNRGT